MSRWAKLGPRHDRAMRIRNARQGITAVATVQPVAMPRPVEVGAGVRRRPAEQVPLVLTTPIGTIKRPVKTGMDAVEATAEAFAEARKVARRR